MIKPESYSPQWLDSKLNEYEATNYDLAEKMTFAFILLEHLKLKGLDFIFKGGTSLVLMLDKFHRFSKDIDIILPVNPGNLNEIFDKVVADTPFTRWEVSERKNDEFQVPKEHYKFYYNQSRPSKFPEQPVLLDIIYVESCYPATRKINLAHSFLCTEEPHTEITIPTLDSIAGDKLSAFAPTTIGIPMGKNKAVEIAKQLFDVDQMFELMESPEVVRESFEQTSLMCITHYKKDYTVENIYNDVINTAFAMAMMGKTHPELFNEIKAGVSSLSQYLNKKTNFGYNVALTAAARIAYLAACLMKKTVPHKLDWKSISPDELKSKKIDHPEYGVLNKALKAGYPEAWYYWLHTANILSGAAITAVPVAIKESGKRSDNLTSLTFIINGKETVLDNVNLNEPLRAAVEQALAKSGSTGRLTSDYLVKYNDVDLDVSKKVGEYHFPKDAKIFLTLKSGEGGK
ncbi:MAG: nucleotidyl transferase AbiEii/AbiGii toxin family protein [Bacteroidetes bacterium]|nr:nucleotidyl transferase AbiEii/AbiGii toxin family protein [Bacteroidota bacterium]